MKKRWYRRKGIKGLCLVLGILSVPAAAVSAGCLAGIAGMGIYPFDSGTYTESGTFSQDMYTNAGTILHALRAEEFLGDGEGLIDLREVSQGGPLSYENTSGLAYRAKDLKKWVSGDWLNADTENVLICTKKNGEEEYLYYDDFREKIEKGELKFLFQDEPEDVEIAYGYEASPEENYNAREELLDWLGNRDFVYGTGIRDSFYGVTVVDDEEDTVYMDVKNFSDYAFPEEYSPQGADSILEVLNQEPDWQGKIYEAYQALSSALNETAEAEEAKKTLEETYQQGETNLQYILVDNNAGRTYTNVENIAASDYDSIRELAENSKNCYMIVSPKEGVTNLKTTLNISLDGWRHMANNFCTDSGDYVFAVWADKNLEIPDFLSQSRDTYEKYARWIPVSLAGGAASVFFLVICFVVLTAGAGKTNRDEEVHLNFFDRWYTEIAAVLVIGIWSLGMMALLNSVTFNLELDKTGYVILFSVLGLWTGGWFFLGWLSLVRRIKAGSLWKNSLARQVFKAAVWLLRSMWHLTCETAELFSYHTASRLKMTLIFTGFCFFQFVVCGMIFAGGAVVLLLALLAADAAGLLFLLRKARGREIILKGLKKITDGDLQYKIPLDRLTGEQKTIAEYINRIGDGLDAAVDSSLKNERMKTELITNVSHDIKTPLTSIISYIDLLKRENLTDPKICGYLDILEEKAQRLKNLTEDVVEASKASTGNISLEMTDLNFVELVQQVIGEFEERFREKNLSLMVHFEEEAAIICADGRRMWRVLENVFSNVSKYAMDNTRVYAEITVKKPKVIFSLKNISAQPLNISADELTERFIRGDVARNTEGSGLGLSIAKSLTELQGGEFRLYLDGDLFKVMIVFTVRETE